MRARIVIAFAVACFAAAALLLGGVFRGSASSGATQEALRAQAAERFQAGFGGQQDTQSLILQLQGALRAKPDDAHSFALLGLAYQQRARETGDPTYYTKSDGVLRRSLTLAPRDPLLATSGLASLAASRHRFREALTLGERARALSPTTARNYGVIGDSLLELGRYREAFRAFDRQSHLKPSLSSYARISYARELLGHWQPSLRAMRLAVDAAGGEKEPLAWTYVQLGKLYWLKGDYAPAARNERFALRIFPGYPYGLDALAQAEAGLGHLRRALALENRAVTAIPLPQYVALLGDLYHVTGREALARKQYALIDVIQRLLVANGVRTDLETALFDVDHARRLPHALALARLAHRDRPSIDGDDVLGWALARNGRCGEALGFSKHALRLGTQDALKFFHRGWIEGCLGHRAAQREWYGRALRLNPRFSLLWAPVARKALA